MAIDVFKRQGKSAVTGLLGKNLRRIAGNIGSVIGVLTANIDKIIGV